MGGGAASAAPTPDLEQPAAESSSGSLGGLEGLLSSLSFAQIPNPTKPKSKVNTFSQLQDDGFDDEVYI